MKLFRSRKRPVSREVTHRGRRAEVGEGGEAGGEFRTTGRDGGQGAVGGRRMRKKKKRRRRRKERERKGKKKGTNLANF